ncbi:MAG: SusC/RagA family TonB-linked outer membrane protein [Candidatus Cyclobacteriaceae bacterium M3_2C_046]
MKKLLQNLLFPPRFLLFFSFLVQWFFIMPLAAQDQQVTGKVTSQEDGEGLPGVNVVEKGSSNGTVTNVEGVYSLEVAPQATLVFSSVGFTSQEVEINGRTVIDLTMSADVQQLEELVVVGYGTQRRKDMTGSISRVSGEDIIQPSSISFDQMLQGQVPGVQISQTSGAPGGNTNVMIRGISSITGGNQPLYVVDGFPIGTGGGGSNMLNFGRNTYSSEDMANNTATRINPLNFINPNDIESIEVLKDASATAIYGSRGSNGVIIITTKRGKTGQSSINVDVSYGLQEVENQIEVLDAQQYAAYVALGRDNTRIFDGGSADDPNSERPRSRQVRPEFRNPASITTNTNWQDVIFRTAPVQNYQVSAVTGNENLKFFVSGGYFDQQGIVITSDYKRFNLRTNVDVLLSEKLKIGTSLTGSYAYGRFPNTNGHYGNGGLITMALAAAPTIPVYDSEGEPYFDFNDVADGLGWVGNPISVANGFQDNRKTADILSNTFLEYEIIDGLTFRTSAGIKYNTNVTHLFRSSSVPRNTAINYPPTGASIKYETINWLNENTLNYRKIFNQEHSLDALVGFTAQKDSYDRLSAGASDFPNDYVKYISAGIVNAGTHLITEWSMLSLMGRVNYAFREKYLVTATVRSDGSSKFGENNKWGTFSSFSLGYNISEEPFMSNLTFINNLKLRASYGFSGNNQIGNYAHIGLLSAVNYVANNSVRPGLVPTSMSNDDLTWERSEQVNFGFDLSLFNERISLTTDIYQNTKTDLLLAVQLPAASGFSTSTQNIGDIENRGVEIGLQTVNIQSNDFEWTSNFTFNANENEVLSLANQGGRIFTSRYQIAEVGYPISSFYLLNAQGVFMNEEELQDAPVRHPRTQPGDLRFEDVNGDGQISFDDAKIVGDPWPDYVWGFNNRFTYKNFSLGISLNGSHGGKSLIYDAVINGASVQNQLAITADRWLSEANPGGGKWPRPIRNNYALGFGRGTTQALFDNSFTRIRNVNLAYKLPQSLVSRLNMTNMSVYLNVANLYTFTDYPGFNPESSTAGDEVVNTGLDDFTYPLPRTYTLGAKFTF